MSDLSAVKLFIQSHKQMAVSTYGEFPWIFTAYYATDPDLNLYFLTSPSTIHSQQISQNSLVAVAIADSPQDPSSNKVGLQLSGVCRILEDEIEVKKALDLWRQALNVQSDDYTLEGMKSGKISGRIYQIAPKKLKFFDQALQEEGTEKLIEL